MMEHMDYICVSSDNPGVEKGIPVDRVFIAQAVIQRIRIREDLGVEQVVETKGFVSFSRSDVRRNALGHT